MGVDLLVAIHRFFFNKVAGECLVEIGSVKCVIVVHMKEQ